MTETNLANIALGHIGVARITDINERSPQAEHCRRMWGLVRDGLLRLRHWNFALTDATLAQVASDPPFGWLYAYQLPVDYILAVEFNGTRAGTGEARFEIKGQQIQTDDDAAELTYVRRVDQAGLWDASFCEAFCFRLAAAIAPAITTSQGMAEKLMQQAEVAAQRAYGPDNLETRPRAVLAQSGSGWLRARVGWCPSDSPTRTRAATATSTPAPTTVTTLITGSDGATYEKTAYTDGRVVYKPVFTTAP